MGVGGAILFVVGAFAGRASSKFAPMGIYYTTGSLCNKLTGVSPFANTLVTTAPAGATWSAAIITQTGGKLKLYITSTCHNVAYFIP